MSEETGKVLLIGDAFVHDVSLAESFKKSGFTSEVVPFDVASLKGFDFNCVRDITQCEYMRQINTFNLQSDWFCSRR